MMCLRVLLVTTMLVGTMVLAATARMPTTTSEGAMPALRAELGQELPNLPGSSKWQAGLDYILVLPPARTAVAQGKIEVLVRFLYTASASRELEMRLQQWERTRRPPYVEVVRKPAIKWPHARILARLYVTLETLGRTDLHGKAFEWIWDEARYKIYHTVMEPDERGINRLNREFAYANGLNAEQFESIYESNAVTREVNMEAVRHHDSGAEVVINGRFGTNRMRVAHVASAYENPATLDRLFRLVEDLVASEAGRLGLVGVANWPSAYRSRAATSASK